MSRRHALALGLVLLLGAGLVAPARSLAAPPRPRVSFTEAQQQFMCTFCGEQLNVARSPEAYNENAELRQLISRGLTLPQIKREMVAQYGTAVLADPPKRGFAVLLIVIPAIVVAAGLLVLAIAIPRWRRRAAAAAERGASGDGSSPGAATSLSDADVQRLDADLARHT